MKAAVTASSLIFLFCGLLVLATIAALIVGGLAVGTVFRRST